jgi:hypothetical protein
MSQESPAVAAATAHVQAWGSHDWDQARRALAPDVKVTATTTNSAVPATELTGVDSYMDGLIQFAQGLEPGSARVIESVGDEHNALLMVSARLAAGGPFGTGTLSGARLYLLDDEGRIKVEQVIFFAAPN